MAKKAVEEGKKVKLKPMGSYERKIIHNALASFKNIKTVSKNREPYRRIVIYPVQEQG
ncbi:MAG: R3H domain-containing nucleic acid-binding protein [Actinomycetota bacterium]|nr:R3H domain-containing nucleic acid-binding protein [Actinomycetota bacterium]